MLPTILDMKNANKVQKKKKKKKIKIVQKIEWLILIMRIYQS